MRLGITRRLSLAAIAGLTGLATACASSSTSLEEAPVNPTTDDYVSRFSDEGERAPTRDELRKSAERGDSEDTGHTAEVSDEVGAAESSVSERDLNALADHYANEASRLYQDERYDEALEHARDALLMDPDHKLASQIQSDVQQTLGVQRSQAGNMAQARSEEETALRAEAVYEISRGIDSADTMMREERFTEAISELEKTLDVIRWTGYMVDTQGYEREARLMIQEAEQKREKQRLDNYANIREQERRIREMQIQRELDRYREEIRNLYQQAKDLFDRREYRESMIVLDKILREDPYNEQVSRLKSIAENLSDGKRDRNAWEDFNRNWKLSMELIKNSNAMPGNDVTLADYDHWLRVQRRAERYERERATPMTQEDIAVRSQLENTTISVFFDETPIDDVLAQFRQEGRINIVLSSDVPRDDTVVLDVGNVRLRQAIDLVTDRLDLDWRVENGAVIIGQRDFGSGGQSVRRVFPVADLVINLRSFQGDEPRLMGDTQGDGRFGAPEPEEFAEEVDIDMLMTTIQDSIAPDSWYEDGNNIDYRQQDLIVRNSPEVVERVNNLLNDLRRSQGITVSIEARFITIRDDFLEDIGLDFRGVGGSPQIPPPGNAPVPAALDDIQFGNQTNPAGPGGTGNDAGFFFQDMPPSGNVRIDQRARIENLFDESLAGQRGNVGLTDEGGMSFQLAFVDNPEINAILRAVRKRERATLLTAPRITVHNTQRGHVSVLNEIAYIRDFDTSTATGIAVADPVVDVIRDGIVLDVRPTVSADRRYVTLELRPTLATLLRPIPTFTTSLGVGSPVAIQTPQLTLQRLRTTVTVPDGGSFVIGGLREMTETDVDSGIPFVSDLPLIGSLFTRRGKSVVRQDVIIVVSARIIDLEEEEEYQYGSAPTSPR